MPYIPPRSCAEILILKAMMVLRGLPLTILCDGGVLVVCVCGRRGRGVSHHPLFTELKANTLNTESVGLVLLDLPVSLTP